MQFEHKAWWEMLSKGRYCIRKVLAIKSNEPNVIFVVDRMTWLDWMRSRRCDKKVCGEIFVSCVISRFRAIW